MALLDAQAVHRTAGSAAFASTGIALGTAALAVEAERRA